jgi:hypothetical protein
MSSRRAGVDWLLNGFKGRSLRLHRAHDVLQVADAACQPVDASNGQYVAFAQEIQNGAQFVATCCGGAATFL